MQNASRLQEIAAVAQALANQIDFQEMVRVITQKAISLFGAETGLLLVLNPKTRQTLKTIHKEGRKLETDRYRLVQINVNGWILEQKQPFLTADLKKDDRFERSQFANIPVKSVAGIPLKIEGRVMGCLLLINERQGGSFSEDDLDLLVNFGAVMTPYLRNSQKLQEYFEAPLDKNTLIAKYNNLGMLGKGEAFLGLVKSIESAARSDVRVLLQGATGTGKGLVAKAIHEFSSRKHAPFVSVNCSTLPANLIESQLFGHVKGAFTGAIDDQQGLVMSANGGTLFMDEIADLPLHLQAKLLSFLQDGEILPIGGHRPQKVNVRIIAAANKSIRELVDQKKFREDLYYRLDVYPIIIPTLNERPEDVPMIADHCLKKFSDEQNKKLQSFDPLILDFIKYFQWQGNIRQLENFIEQMVTIAPETAESLTPEFIPPNYQEAYRKFLQADLDLPDTSLQTKVQDFEKKLITDALQQHQWNQSKAARYLKIAEGTLRYKIEKLAIEKPS